MTRGWLIQQLDNLSDLGGLMAKEGAPHATMIEAFGTRLRQLYPEPPTVYSEGKKITLPGSKK